MFLRFPDRKAIVFSGRECFIRSMERSGNLRNANLKDIILNKLLPQHDDTELDTEFNQTASRSTLGRKHTRFDNVTLSRVPGFGGKYKFF